MSAITIVCDFNLGTRAQTIYKCNSADNTVESIGDAYFDQLAPALVSACYKYDTPLIHLYGPTEILAGLKEEIHQNNTMFKHVNPLVVNIN